ncbi:glutathione S-transferase C-terminal domain-containing protein [Aerococcus sp. UMB10185]|uniref:glutathione S-transferase C-terminal domain-containing protein n=1 Tax=unclassified Aerococcus TaxID=2618060 RepID=UPI0008A51CA8|nr:MULTISPECIES: glutathione S-transferase C-terminal domain-containing protein [unclassified Aerococcus]MDK6233199.1 glutathione S-transferase C-terminal domain-containing protein [Aerococcus sp. UMB10185]MDK6856036.1 glutathione S-transferase C-terminal domain-containing protein [Aerococcus sp. UMB7533]MDK8502369.1 glutathione S-transferase C-terminal domain-containing protein [Aerococcus sp. UMB1112A]OFN00285.1 glutathione-dependent reductase [Aerococcus sp. HMSC062A02]OHO45012.1 glutathion
MSKHPVFAKEIQADGSFVQQGNVLSKPFSYEEGGLKPEANRYQLVWMPACPHAHKVVIAIHLLGLDTIIPISATGPYRTDEGWVFSDYPGGRDPLTGARSTLELYQRSIPDYDLRPTVPLIVDLRTGQAVNNDHKTLTLQLETVWQDFHAKGAPDLYPEALRPEIDRLNRLIYEEINVGFYKVGFAESQSAYEQAYDNLFESLDFLEDRLSQSRYLCGDQLTDADLRLYPSLARYDVVYYDEFRCRERRLRDYPHLWRYARELYQIPAFGQTTDFNFIKASYYRSPHLKALFGNSHNILPKGPDLTPWQQGPTN